MPTPTGKPKVGERIRVQIPGGIVRFATVLERYDGLCWGLRVKPDDSARTDFILEAGWMMEKGYLKVVEKEEHHPEARWCSTQERGLSTGEVKKPEFIIAPKG